MLSFCLQNYRFGRCPELPRSRLSVCFLCPKTACSPPQELCDRKWQGIFNIQVADTETTKVAPNQQMWHSSPDWHTFHTQLSLKKWSSFRREEVLWAHWGGKEPYRHQVRCHEVTPHTVPLSRQPRKVPGGRRWLDEVLRNEGPGMRPGVPDT